MRAEQSVGVHDGMEASALAGTETPPRENGQTARLRVFESEPGRRASAKLLTETEARRIAVNIPELPEPAHAVLIGCETPLSPRRFSAPKEGRARVVEEQQRR